MAVSHSFTGKYVEDGSDEKADPKRDHRSVKHFLTFGRVPICKSAQRKTAVAKPQCARPLPLATHATVRGRTSGRRNRAGINSTNEMSPQALRYETWLG